MGYPPAFIEYSKQFSKQFSMTLTSLRKAVLFELWQSKKPLKAYDIVELLTDIKPNVTAATVYRALDYFMQVGLLHKIESIQSYVLCTSPEHHFPSEILMVCENCQEVVEVYDAKLRELLMSLAHNASFQLSPHGIELHGTCTICKT